MDENRDYYDEINLMDYLNVIWKRKWLIIIPTILLVIAAGVYSFLKTPVWEVEAIIQPSKFLVQTQTGEFEEVLVVSPQQLAGQIGEGSYTSLLASELSIDLRRFPKLKAENLRDTNLVRVSLRDEKTARGRSILLSLFQHVKRDLDRKIDVEIKSIDTQIEVQKNKIQEHEIEIKDRENNIHLKRLQMIDRENEIKTKQNNIKKKENALKSKDLEIEDKKIEKNRLLQSIESDKSKLKISEERIRNIMEEMKSVKSRIDEIEAQQRKALEGKKEGVEAISLLLYSNEIQQNFRYYNTLDEKLSNEKIIQENLKLSIQDKEEGLKKLDNDISQIETQKESIKVDIENIETEIVIIRNNIDKIKNEIENIKNGIAKIKSNMATIQSEIRFLEDEKDRIDYAQLIKEPTPSLNPVSPRKKLNVVLAGLIGLMLFTFLAFFLEYMEKNKQSLKESSE